eukprot:10364684-Alexandrium_andersonii.AAC.1
MSGTTTAWPCWSPSAALGKPKQSHVQDCRRCVDGLAGVDDAVAKRPPSPLRKQQLGLWHQW